MFRDSAKSPELQRVVALADADQSVLDGLAVLNGPLDLLEDKSLSGDSVIAWVVHSDGFAAIAMIDAKIVFTALKGVEYHLNQSGP